MYYLYRDVSWSEEILPNLADANWALVVCSFILGYSATIIRGLRWNIMLEPLGHHAPEWTNIHSVAFGYSMNNLVPRSGELARCTLLNRATKIPVDQLIGTVILERIVDSFILLSLMAIAFGLHRDDLQHLLSLTSGGVEKTNQIGWIFWCLIAGFIALVFLLRWKRNHPWIQPVVRFLNGILQGIKTIFKLKRKLLFIVYSLGIWMCWIFMTFAFMQALPATHEMTFTDTLFFMAASSIGMIAPTPGGAGTYHGMSELAFMAMNKNKLSGKIFALISWTAKTTFDILIGFVGFFIVTAKSPNKKA
jgi:uncharacterized protein (TIRG00374 family)